MHRTLRTFTVLASLLMGPVACVHTESSPGSGQFPSDAVMVTGEGEAYGAPNIVNLQLGVEARAEDPKVAIEAANQKMEQLIATLKAEGVRAPDMQTRDFNIHSEHYDPERPIPLELGAVSAGSRGAEMAVAAEERAVAAPAPAVAPAGKALKPAQPPPPSVEMPAPPAPPQPRLVYRVSNMLHLTVRQIDKVGDVLSRAVEAGANQAWGVSFDIDDPDPLAAKARAQAMADARQQAEELAKLAGVKLGPVISVIDDDAGAGPMPAANMRLEKAQVSSVPVEGGQLAVRRRVRVVYAIDRDRE